jgi:hypothetical protein
MPIYPYRCLNKHYTEKFFSMGSQAREVPCACGESAKRVFTAPLIAVDNTDKVDYTVAAGRNFSNKRELEAWMREKNVHVADDSEWASDREALEQEKEFRHSLASKGIDYAEYIQDKKQSEIRDQDELMRKMGVKVEQVEPSEYLGASSSDGWVDTVESDYQGSTYTNSRGQEVTRLAKSAERVECPYSDLTNGAVSNV